MFCVTLQEFLLEYLLGSLHSTTVDESFVVILCLGILVVNIFVSTFCVLLSFLLTVFCIELYIL